MQININVAGKTATADEGAVIVCGNSDYELRFSFDSEWADHTVKTARFTYQRYGRLLYTEKVFEGDVCPVPVLTDILEMRVGVYAGNLSTTTPAVISCEPSILCGSGVHEEPQPDVYNQIIEMIEAGMLKGEDGDTPVKGVDYYTEADKAEMVEEVLAAMPDGDEVSY